MNFDTVLTILVVIALLAWIVYRQVYPRKLNTRVLVIIPLVILFFIVRALPTFHPSASQIEEIAITSFISLVFGLLACRSLRVYPSPETGKAMVAGSWTYFLWWLASFAVKAALAFAFGETSLAAINEAEILLPAFLLMSTRNAYLYWRAMQLGLQLH